jgi:hypothetical protein
MDKEESVALGYGLPSREGVYLDQDGRRHSTYILGMRQYGKSNLLEYMALGDILNGHGICFIDPLGKSADKLVDLVPKERRGHIIFWNVADHARPFGFNPFFCPNRQEVSKKANEFLDLLHNLEEFREAFKNAPRMNEVIFHLAVTFLANQGSTLSEAHQFLGNKDYRKAFYKELEPDFYATRQFWKDVDERPASVPATSYDAALNKLSRFIRSDTLAHIFGQTTNSIDFRYAMVELSAARR